jgi:hypothetical protein
LSNTSQEAEDEYKTEGFSDYQWSVHCHYSTQYPTIMSCKRCDWRKEQMKSCQSLNTAWQSELHIQKLKEQIGECKVNEDKSHFSSLQKEISVWSWDCVVQV